MKGTRLWMESWNLHNKGDTIIDDKSKPSYDFRRRQLRLNEIPGTEEWAAEELRGEGNEVLAYVDTESHPHYDQNELRQCAGEL